MPDRCKPGPKPRPGGPIKNRYVLRAGDPWWDWFVEFAGSVDQTKAGVIDAALRDYAERAGFRPPPERGA